MTDIMDTRFATVMAMDGALVIASVRGTALIAFAVMTVATVPVACVARRKRV